MTGNGQQPFLALRATPGKKHKPLAVALGASVLLIPFISWGQTPWITAPFAVLVVVIFSAVMREIKEGGTMNVPEPPLLIPLGAVLGLGLVHLARSPVPYSSLLFLLYLSLAAVLYWLWWSLPSPLSPLTAILVWAGVVVPWITVEGLLGAGQGSGGPFLNPNYTATVLLVCLAMALGGVTSSREGRGMTATLMVASTAVSAGLMLIGSRSAGLGMILLWSAFFVLRRGNLRWAAVVAIAVIVLLPNTIRYRVTEGYKADPHAFSRLQIWEASLRMGADHPVIGVGPGLFYEHAPVYAFPTDDLPVRYGRIARKPHNEYLRSWAEGGVIGVSAMGLFLIIVLRMAVAGLREGKHGAVLSTGVILYQALFHDVTEVLALLVMMAWCLAQLTPAAGRTLSLREKPMRALPAVAGVLVLCLGVLISLDVVSRGIWLKGRNLMASDLQGAFGTIDHATRLNPLLPGAARDLARTRLMLSHEEGSSEHREQTLRSILAALRLNRLDTVPLRLRAAYYRGVPRHEPEAASQALALAVLDLTLAASLEPHNALIWLDLSRLHWDLGQRQRALTLLQRALAEEPNYLQAHRDQISWLRELDPVRVLEAESGLAMAEERAAGYEPHSEYEEIILR